MFTRQGSCFVLFSVVNELVKKFRGNKKQRYKFAVKGIGSNLTTKTRGELWQSLTEEHAVLGDDAGLILDNLEQLKVYMGLVGKKHYFII